jgi:hypothetical protein
VKIKKNIRSGFIVKLLVGSVPSNCNRILVRYESFVALLGSTWMKLIVPTYKIRESVVLELGSVFAMIFFFTT